MWWCHLTQVKFRHTSRSGWNVSYSIFLDKQEPWSCKTCNVLMASSPNFRHIAWKWLCISFLCHRTILDFAFWANASLRQKTYRETLCQTVRGRGFLLQKGRCRKILGEETLVCLNWFLIFYHCKITICSPPFGRICLGHLFLLSIKESQI